MGEDQHQAVKDQLARKRILVCLLICSVLLILALAVGNAGGDRSTSALPVQRIDLNQADAGHLSLLPRIGPVMAVAIRQDLKANGPFLSVDDVTRVPGIGPKTLELIRPHVTVGSVADSTQTLPVSPIQEPLTQAPSTQAPLDSVSSR